MPDRAEPLIELLGASLSIWGVSGVVEPGDSELTAIIRAGADMVIMIERAPPSDRPIRWWIRWSGATARTRPSNSVIGLLRTVRQSLQANSGAKLRIARPSAT